MSAAPTIVAFDTFTDPTDTGPTDTGPTKTGDTDTADSGVPGADHDDTDTADDAAGSCGCASGPNEVAVGDGAPRRRGAGGPQTQTSPSSSYSRPPCTTPASWSSVNGFCKERSKPWAWSEDSVRSSA